AVGLVEDLGPYAKGVAVELLRLLEIVDGEAVRRVCVGEHRPRADRRAPVLPGELRDMALDVLRDRFAHPALGRRVGHPVAAEQHLLVGYRQAGETAAHTQTLAQE